MASEGSSFEQATALLTSLIAEARARGNGEASTAALATASVDSQPSVRTVSVVGITSAGLIIFAHTETGKGRQMLHNPRAALCFHWPKMHYQVIVEGDVSLLSEEESDAKWRSLPRDYSLGHWASDQAVQADAQPSPLSDKAREYRQQFDWTRVPRAPFWRAFEIRPNRIDFWPSGWQRLLLTECYLRAKDGSWIVSRENP